MCAAGAFCPAAMATGVVVIAIPLPPRPHSSIAPSLGHAMKPNQTEREYQSLKVLVGDSDYTHKEGDEEAGPRGVACDTRVCTVTGREILLKPAASGPLRPTASGIGNKHGPVQIDSHSIRVVWSLLRPCAISSVPNHESPSSPPTPPEAVEMGQMKAKNGFSTTEIGAYHMGSPCDPLLEGL
uniref:Uncharacterized protein n=1 Tax=Eutreptiella gymnastica TaxID=73025 RepID=A0A7S1J8X1_9EUGL|mmetsp:Transcript_76790/g.135612  ORF Transcript_76790/g.135612 Transcript_76790/m.135612 type:complete len:183 (+) Transcript_76790:306-854(+)